MFSKIVVGLLAATMFTAPVLAQGTAGGAATSKAPVTTTAPKGAVIAPVAKPAVTAPVAKPVAAAPVKVIKKSTSLKRHAGRHMKRVAHVKRHKAIKQVRHIKRVRAIRTTLRTSAPQASVKPMVRTGIN